LFNFDLLRSKSNLQPLDRMSDKLKLGHWSCFLFLARDTLSERSPNTPIIPHVICKAAHNISVSTNCVLVEKVLHEVSHSNNCMVWSHIVGEKLFQPVYPWFGECVKKRLWCWKDFAWRGGYSSHREYLQFEYFNHTTICPSTSLIG